MSYLDDIHPKKTDTTLVSLSMYAEKNDVPIITDEGLRFLSQMIRLNKVRRIIEIGTAIGYSAIAMAKVDPSIEVVTIERDETMQEKAKEAIKASNLEHRITLIEADALTFDETTLEESFDMLFIDGAKSQSIPFFEKYAPLIRRGGLIITDNLLFHGFLEKDGPKPSNRNTRQLIRKIDRYNHFVLSNKDYDTAIHPIGDGMSLSIKRID